MNKFYMCMQLIKYKRKDNKYKESRDRESKYNDCYQGPANCLRPYSKYDDLEIPLWNELLFTMEANISLTTYYFSIGANLT